VVRFAHLHCHSHYSLLDGNARIADLCAAAAADGQERIALTDHGNLFGAIEFYRAATAQKLTPVLGCEVNVVKDHRRREAKEPFHHLTLLAENRAGWANLMRLVSRGFLDGFYFKPRVDRELLAGHADGIIALSGCMSGELSRRVLAGDLDQAVRVAEEHREIFGRERYFIEVMDNEIPLQKRQRDGILDVARRTGIEALLTQDVHYLKPEEATAREVMMCIGASKTLGDENRPRLDTDKHHFRTRAEMAALFAGADVLCERAFEVAARCNVELEFGKFHLPRFEIPTGEEPFAFFERLCREGIRARYGDDPAPRVLERLRDESGVIREMGFVTYFLIVADLVRFAKERGVPVGPGRGSAAGSIVSYALGITDVDPLRYDLLFERFLSRGRVSMPDIDIDFCRDRRAEVMRYVTEKYGRDNVCQIVTFGTMAAKAAIRDAGRVLGIDLAKVDGIAKRIPTVVGTKLKAALEQDAELQGMIEADAEVQRLFDVSLRIEGLNRHASTHAAGVVITDRELTAYVPLCRVQEEVNTQFSMGDLESIGLLKMDFLGLKTLTILRKAEEYVRASGVDVRLDRLPLDDQRTYAMLQRGETTGIFQLESRGMRELLQKMKPDVFEDIVAILALYRPGPLGSGMVDSFVNRKHGVEVIEYPHPSLEPILRETYGVMVYQEQIMRISNVLAGFSLEEADTLRKAMGKKKPEVMEKYKGTFVAGAEKNGVERKVAEGIWDTMAFFAGYGFNKSHTVAYGIVTYQTAWLKANHTQEFLAACMSIDRGDTDKVAEYLDECRRYGIEVRNPDLNASDLDFTIEEGAIRFGLGAIKGVGEKPVAAILEARRRLARPFRSLTEVFEEVDCAAVHKAVWEKMNAAGAFDWTGVPRGRIDASLDVLVRAGQAHQADRRAGQLGLFAAAAAGARTADVPLADAPDWPEREKLRREKEVFGFHLTDNPLRRHAATLARFSTHSLAGAAAAPAQEAVTVGGVVAALRITTAKRGRSAGQRMASFKIAGLDGATLDAVCFAEDYRLVAEILVDDAICLFSGTIGTSREEPSLRVTRVEPVERVLERRVERVVLTIEREDEALLDEVKERLLRFAGNVPVYLRFPRAAGEPHVVRCGESFRVRLSEDGLDALTDLLGKENVSCS
jgi:DNA polymerase-3 subunit alpha